MRIQKFTFNPFQENTYVFYDDSTDCVIVDPGTYYAEEKNELNQFIRDQQLNPSFVVNTHCHIDHVFGNGHFCNEYGVSLVGPKSDQFLLDNLEQTAHLYGIPGVETSPPIEIDLNDKEEFGFGETSLRVLQCPGHTPGHICFYHEPTSTVVVGDVLFSGSIGRTDLPGGDYQTLINSITSELMSLPDDTTVFCGHGPETSIGQERRTNPFLN